MKRGSASYKDSGPFSLGQLHRGNIDNALKRQQRRTNNFMEQDQQQRLNQAAEQFTDALVEQLRTVSSQAIGVQEQGTQLTQNFFNRVVENLRTQAQRNRQMTQQLVDQQQRGAEAAQQLTQETVDAYTSLVNSMVSSFQQGSGQMAQSRGATTEVQEDTRNVEEPPPRVESSTPEVEETPSEDGDEELTIEDYDSLSVRQISERLGELSDEEVERLRRYEAANKNRSTLLRRLDERL